MSIARILDLLRKVYLYFSVAFQDTECTDALEKYPSYLKCSNNFCTDLLAALCSSECSR
jgi:hypothetical protein